MFLAYLNELAEVLANFGIKVNFFADDVKVYARITNDVDRLVLQEAVDAPQPADMNWTDVEPISYSRLADGWQMTLVR